MVSTVINTRADLDAATGTPQHAAFMAMLAGSLWRLERDDEAATWRAVEDNTAIERFGFTRADFPGAVAPDLPVYVPMVKVVAPISPRQIRQALTRAGLREAVEAAVAAGDQDLKDWYEFSTAFERDNIQVTAMGAALGVTDAELDDLWLLGASL